MTEADPIQQIDPDVARAIEHEIQRQQESLELIASENFVSPAVLAAAGSVFTNKYAEGYPGRRYYGGCEFVDDVERLARQRACALFGADHANVQPHSGSQANMAAYFSALSPGDKILGMNLSHGGHLTHGHPLNFSGSLYKVIPYGVTREEETIDYQELESLARKERPQLIVVGASAYSRFIDFQRIKKVADEIEAKVMVDMAHIAGLIAAGVHPSPVPHADFVTTTTHKTLRGPRGGVVLCKKEHAKIINKKVFPGIQGGPLVHIIAAKAICFKEASTQEFRTYQKQVIENAKVLAASIADEGFRIVSGGTDNHLFLVDVDSRGLTGKIAEDALEQAGITVNKNAIPFDNRPPMEASGIRIGSPAVTTRGMGLAEMKQIGHFVGRVLADPTDTSAAAAVKKEVIELCNAFPLPYGPTARTAA